MCRAGGWDGAQQAEERGESSSVHQTHGDLQHVVPQRKVREALPEALHGFSGAAARFEERFFGIFEARHRGRWRGFAEKKWRKLNRGLEGVDGGFMRAGGANVMETRNWFQKRVGWSSLALFGLGCGLVLARRRANIYCAVCTVL